MEKMSFPNAPKNNGELQFESKGITGPTPNVAGLAAGDTTMTMKEPTFAPDLDLCKAHNHAGEVYPK